MKKILALFALAFATVGSAMAAETPVYVGGEVGYSHAQNLGYSDNGPTGGGYVGYDFTKHFAAEAGYTRLNNIVAFGGTAKPEAFTLEGVGKVNVLNDKTTVFAKGGVAYGRVTGDVSQSHYSPMVGVGAEYAVNQHVSAVAEVQYVHNFADADIHVFNTSVGLKYQF